MTFIIIHKNIIIFFFSSSLLVGRWPVYSSASLHLFIGRPRFLFPSGIPSRTFLTIQSSAILDMCSLHSVLLLCTHDVTFWITHDSRILSYLVLSHFVLFVILLNIIIIIIIIIIVIIIIITITTITTTTFLIYLKHCSVQTGVFF